MTKIKLVRVNLKKNFSVKMLAEFLEEKQENIELICESIHANPDMNDEEVWALIKEQWKYISEKSPQIRKKGEFIEM